MAPDKGYKPAQEIRHFYCRPCGEYHDKEHPHFAEMQERAKKRKAKQRKAKASSDRGA